MSQQIQCLIIGNDNPGTRNLPEYVEKISWLSLVCKPINVREAMHYLQEFKVQVLFCNVDTLMETEMGLFLNEQATGTMIIVVDSKMALSSVNINSNVFSFLAIPVTFDQFYYTISRAKDFLQPVKIKQLAPMLDFVFVKSEYKFYKVKFSDILFCEGMKDYTQIYMADKPKPLITLQNLKTFVSKLPPHDFVRVHRSYVISLKSIDVVSKNEITIGNKFIPIGESYRSSLFEIIHQSS